METNDRAIDVQGLRAAYGDHVAVDGVDLTVDRGELVALLGTNGAGKTTTMETIEGHRAAQGGTVTVLGHDPWRDRDEIRPRMGIMLQSSGFAGELTVHETAKLWTRLRSRAGSPDAALERLDLAHRRDVQVKQLSGGEQRRLDMAIALLGDPEVLFLDEPSTGLDPQSRRRTWDVIADLVAGGTAVLMTTHYMEEAEKLADRIAILDGGRIAREGTMAQLVAGLDGTISFVLPEDDDPRNPPPALPDLAGTVEAARGGVVVVTTDHLQRDLATLLAWADGHDLALGRLQASESSLDDVFAGVQA
ncbi:ABC transporter ATP-binding protein [Patulibacter sp.]|uniref:ABC transporter ATP-binding protein n=1 Tax=Patulibacter sp. TaxID=1912859 RepID=UPI00271CCAE0|nr:ABC transporter ATP-binding protein [Patulibacter sp.]MDO9410860.1 ABC transporter ATP-binding protein [Patulibacter sp.]